jgi:hypothetical protein
MDLGNDDGVGWTVGGVDGSAGRVRGWVQRAWRWVALSGDRRVVAGVVLLVGFVVNGPLGYTVLTPVNPEAPSDSVTVPLVAALLSGTFLLFSVVVSVNSLFVSQQQNPIGKQYGRIQEVVSFRRRLEDEMDVAYVPADPETLLRTLSGEILARAQQIESELSTADFALAADLDAYVESLARETGEMNDGLADATTPFGVVHATMDYNHDQQLDDLRELDARYGDEMTDATTDTIADLLSLLQYFAAAREYFKTLYTRAEFANLSRDLVLTAVPTVGIVATYLHYLESMPDAHMLVTAVEAIAFAPFVLVASYVLRVAVVSRHTQAAGQFVAGDHGGDVDPIESD